MFETYSFFTLIIIDFELQRRYQIPRGTPSVGAQNTRGRAGFRGPREPGPHASHQQRASHQTHHILFVVHASCLQRVDSTNRSLQSTNLDLTQQSHH